MAGVYSVTQVNSYIKHMFSQDFLLRRLSVKGEVSNCKYHTSGHIYFTLKDEGGTLAAVMFASQRRGLKMRLQEGQQVVVKGTVDVYERDGRYQLYAQEIELAGRGDLYVKYEKLLYELKEMGMFDPIYKQPIPRYAKTVGIVTAPTGAAIRDIMNISARRNPYVQLVLYPALVQGDGAKESIVQGIRTLDAMGLDVLIVGRGGGSIEDLWAFNEEEVARAIFACSTPVISAVGHETDTTIADYVADLRAPTPSAAAELAVFDYELFEAELEAKRRKLDREMSYLVEQARNRIKRQELRVRLHHPQHKIKEQKNRLAELEDRMNRRMRQQIEDAKRETLGRQDAIARRMERRLEDDKKRLAVVSGRMWGLSPLKKLSQGYGFVTDEAGERLASIGQAPEGSRIHVQVADGKITARVEERREAEGWK